MTENIQANFLASKNGEAMTANDLNIIVQRHPYYHAARIALLQRLYEKHDSSYTKQLRRAALYLPSREAVFGIVENSQFKPKSDTEPMLSGATVAHKVISHIKSNGEEAPERTESLIGTFLNSLTPEQAICSEHKRSLRPIDATQDYIGYMLQEEEETRRLAALEAARKSMSEPVTPRAKVLVPQTDEIIGRFIEENGEHRIRLRDSSDEELRRPNLQTENYQGQGAFTEALARIYIKQGKFLQAIEIIRRLSLKYPKKNTYFADQIRFLEKLLLNQQLLKTKKDA